MSTNEATMTIKYNSSVLVDAGWRSVTITAKAARISKGMAQVIEITEIDGEAPAGYTSRTGAKRQRYNARAIALREVGARKRLSSCEIVS